MTYTMQPSMNGNGAKVPNASQAWLYASVHDFFSGFNWDDRPAVVSVADRPSAGVASEAVPLSLAMSVGGFWAAFNWDGTAAIAAAPVPAQPQPTPPKASEFTLDEFSDLF